MSKPRTPEHFPRMKVRGGRRRRDAAFREAWSFDWAEISRNIAQGLSAVREAMAETARAIERMVSSLQAVMIVAAWRQSIRWVATHQLPATPSPYAAPIER